MGVKTALTQVREFFGMTISEMSKEWRVLSEEDKEWFKKEVSMLWLNGDFE